MSVFHLSENTCNIHSKHTWLSSGQPLERLTLFVTLSALLQWLMRVNSLSTIISTASVIYMAQKHLLTLAAIAMKREGQQCPNWQTVHQASHRHAQ